MYWFYMWITRCIAMFESIQRWDTLEASRILHAYTSRSSKIFSTEKVNTFVKLDNNNLQFTV